MSVYFNTKLVQSFNLSSDEVHFEYLFPLYKYQRVRFFARSRIFEIVLHADLVEEGNFLDDNSVCLFESVV